MARINLLPWRDAKREERKKHFLLALGATLAIAAGLVFLSGQFLDGLLEQQNARNQFIQTEIAKLDERIKKVREVREQRQQILGRMQVIQDLQGNRSLMPHLFDQLVRTLPDGVFFSSLDMQGQRINISGYAESSNRVSALMRNMDSSPWLSGATLSAVRATDSAPLGGQANQFQLTVRQNRPSAEQLKGAMR